MGLLGIVALVILPIPFQAPAQADANIAVAADKTNIATRAEKAFHAARGRSDAEPRSAEAAWKFGRACFDWADLASSDKEREKIANLGIAACRNAIERDPKGVPGHYYLGMNLGQLARTKSLGALKIVNEMEREFKTARDLDERYDFAGPDRNLGLLYRDAPGWPTSVGNRNKARQHLERTIELSPDYPENHLNLLEASLKWGDKKGVDSELKVLDELWPNARKNFSGEAWEANWVDWENRRKKIREKPGKPLRPTQNLPGKR